MELGIAVGDAGGRILFIRAEMLREWACKARQGICGNSRVTIAAARQPLRIGGNDDDAGYLMPLRQCGDITSQ